MPPQGDCPSPDAARATRRGGKEIESVAPSGDGRLVDPAFTRWDNGFDFQTPAEIRVRDSATGETPVTLSRQPGQVFARSPTGDGKSLISASLSGAVLLWDLASFRVASTRPR